jgi:5-methylcytosine-specific restriction protein A
MTKPSCLDVTDENAVLAAIKEFKEFGRDKFLKKHGFKRARQYFIVYEGKRYDCKPILVSAYHHQYKKPLGDHKATGGVNPKVKPHLESMGFTVIDINLQTSLKVITSIEEIEQNLSLFEKYLCGEVSPESQKFAYGLIKRGACFIAYKTNSEWRFAPSRYVGYTNNSMKTHNDNQNKDGKETNPAIDSVLDCTLAPNKDIEAEYLSFCEKLGINPDNKQRKYWLLKITDGDSKQNSNSDDGFPEGKVVERVHKARERNTQLISSAKADFLANHKKLYCIVCKFDFEQVYGKRGQGYIEAHHTIPVSEMKVGDTTKVTDIALVCSNCHRMLHRTRPWLKMDELEELLENDI